MKDDHGAIEALRADIGKLTPLILAIGHDMALTLQASARMHQAEIAAAESGAAQHYAMAMACLIPIAGLGVLTGRDPEEVAALLPHLFRDVVANTEFQAARRQ